jgi:cell division protein FtsN
MYCENCQLEISEQEETQCPLCGGPISQSPAAGTMPDNAVGIDFDAMQDDASAFVLDDDDSGGMELESQPARETDKRSTEPEMRKPAAADHARKSGAPAVSTAATTDMLDQVLEEYDPMVDEHFKIKKTGSQSRTTLLLIVLLLCVLGAGGYYYFVMSGSAPPEPVAPVKIATPKKQNAVLDQVLRKETAPVQSAQQSAGDNATQAAKKPEAVKPAQTVEKKIEAPIIAEQQPADVKPVEPAAASRTPEQAPQKDNKQPAVAMEKTEPAPPAPQAVKVPAPSPVPVQQTSPAPAKPAAEEPKKPAAPAAAPAEKPQAAGAGKPVFSVLTGSFRSQSYAEAEVSRFRKLGFDARTVKVDLKGKGQWHRVLIGSWTRRAEALQMADDVRRKTGKKDASVITAE